MVDKWKLQICGDCDKWVPECICTDPEWKYRICQKCNLYLGICKCKNPEYLIKKQEV